LTANFILKMVTEMSKGQKKGSAFERKMCKVLSRWYSRGMKGRKGERDDIFWRTDGSGARATCRMKKGLSTSNSCGDVATLSGSGRRFIRLCMIELKKGYTAKKNQIRNESVSITNLVDSQLKNKKKEPILLRWVKKAIKEAEEHNRKHPIIIFQRDRKEPCIVIQRHTFQMLTKNFRRFINSNDGTLLWVQIQGLDFLVFPLSNFLWWCPPQAFFRKVRVLKRKDQWNIGQFGGKRIRNFKGF
jgi:hypothetical protein